MSTDIRKRLIIVIALITLMLAAASTWLIQENDKPYSVRTAGTIKLYVPEEYLGPKPDDLIEMVEAYIRNQSGLHRFQVTASDFLSDTYSLPATALETSIIWTVETQATSENATNSFLPSEDISLLSAILSGDGPETEPQTNGLLKIYRDKKDPDAFSFSNLTLGSMQPPNNAWIAHCIRFSALREGGSWGRCSRQIHANGLKISLHFDGLLVEQTAAISSEIANEISRWQTPPKN